MFGRLTRDGLVTHEIDKNRLVVSKAWFPSFNNSYVDCCPYYFAGWSKTLPTEGNGPTISPSSSNRGYANPYRRQ